MKNLDFEKYAINKEMNGMISDNFINFFLKYALPLMKKNPTILDYGCGDGKYFDFFKKYTHHDKIFGTEVSRIRIDRCISKGFSQVFQIDQVTRTLPFSDNTFDLINFDQVIEHIPYNYLNDYLQELWRVLSVDGVIIIMTPNYPTKRLYDFYDAFRGVNYKKMFDDPTHVSKFNFGSLRKICDLFFDVIELQPTGGYLWDIFRADFFSRKMIGLLQKKNK